MAKKVNLEKKIQTQREMLQENHALKQAMGLFQSQARQAMVEAAEAGGKSLYLMKLIAAAIIQNGGKLEIKHKTVADLPNDINLARGESEDSTAYIYRLVSLEEINSMVDQQHANAEPGVDKPLIVAPSDAT